MKNFDWEKLTQLPFENIRKVADLTYFEGPRLSLFRDDEEVNYIYYWCDFDETVNRWLVFEISDGQLDDYIGQKIPLTKLICNPIGERILVLDTDDEGNHISILETGPSQLPNFYGPTEATYYDPSSTVVYEQEFNQELLGILSNEIQRLSQENQKIRQEYRIDDAIIQNYIDEGRITFRVIPEIELAE